MKYPVLYQHYNSIAPICAEDWLWAESFFKYNEVKKGELIVKPGDICTNFSIILKGIFRLYYIGTDGKEYIKAFRSEHELVAPYAEILQNVPSRTFIEALEPTEFITAKFDDIETLSDKSPRWREIRAKITEKLFLDKEKREYELLQLSAKERYYCFVKDYPKIAQRVSQYHIASYLGVTSVGLSRIINRKN